MPKQKFIKIQIAYYIDENGKVVYDHEGMENELQDRIDELEGGTD